MVFNCTCGEEYRVADNVAPVSFRCHRCGSVLVRANRKRRSRAVRKSIARKARGFRYVGLAAFMIAVAAGLLGLNYAQAGDSLPVRQGIAMRTDTMLSDGDDAAAHGLLKVINDSGKAIALRLVGPEYSDSRTILIPAWEDRRAFGLLSGKWVAKYCTGSDWQPDAKRFSTANVCAEFDETLQYTEFVADETRHYSVAIVRFGPTPRESPPSHAITAEDFAAD